MYRWLLEVMGLTAEHVLLYLHAEGRSGDVEVNATVTAFEHSGHLLGQSKAMKDWVRRKQIKAIREI